MKKKLIFLASALLITVLICSCAAEEKTIDAENSISTPKTNTELPTETTPQTAVDPDEKNTVKNETETEAELYHGTEEATSENEEMMQISKGNELKLVDFTDCSVAVLGFFCTEPDGHLYGYLSEEDLTEFLDCITNADISPEEYTEELPPFFFGGDRNDFKVKLNTGEIIFIHSDYIDTLIHINGKVFPCNEECNRKLDELYDKVLKEYREKEWRH